MSDHQHVAVFQWDLELPHSDLVILVQLKSDRAWDGWSSLRRGGERFRLIDVGAQHHAVTVLVG